MPLKPRKAEIEQMMAAIEDCQSLEEVANKALVEASKIVQSRQTFIIATDARLLYGPYWTDTEAYNALAGGDIEGFVDEEGIKEIRKNKGIPTLSGKAAVMALKGPTLLAEEIDEKDLIAKRTAERSCLACGHSIPLHGVTNRSTACSIHGCTCKKPRQ